MSGKQKKPRAKPVPPPRDPKRRFDKAELKMIQLAIDDLLHFHAGYLHVERLRHQGVMEGEPHLDRFFESAFVVIVDGLYPADRNRGLMPALRLVGCKKLADEIEAALDRKIGGSTFAQLQNNYRDKAIAHPHYTMEAMKLILDDHNQHLDTEENQRAFGEASNTIRTNTAAAMHWFRLNYPEIVADTEASE